MLLEIATVPFHRASQHSISKQIFWRFLEYGSTGEYHILPAIKKYSGPVIHIHQIYSMNSRYYLEYLPILQHIANGKDIDTYGKA